MVKVIENLSIKYLEKHINQSVYNLRQLLHYITKHLKESLLVSWKVLYIGQVH